MKIYIIILEKNLPEKDERIRRMMDGIPFEYHLAFNGVEKLSDEEIAKYTVSPEARAHSKGVRHIMKKAEYGCIRSHVDVAKKAKATGVKSYIVLEEDAVISSDFVNRIKMVEDEMPENTDMVFLGRKYKGPRTKPGYDRKVSRFLPINIHRKTKHLWDFGTVKHYGTFGIYVKSKAYDEIIRVLEEYDDIADLKLNKSGKYGNLNILNLVPSCTYKPDGYSFINNTMRDYKDTKSLYSPTPHIEDAPGIRKFEGSEKYEVHYAGNFAHPKVLL
jgi:GR25 family glycosyltransferase involved in LPS biosynthesis